MRNVNCNCLSAIDTSSQNGIQLDSNQWVSASFQSIFGDATATGTVKIQMSNDICNFGNLATDFTVTNWSDVPNATSAIASGVGPAILIANCSFRWMRAVFTRASGGSTTVNINVNALSI